MVYKGTRQVVTLHWYLTPFPNCLNPALPNTAPSNLLAEGLCGRLEGIGGKGAYFAIVKRGLSGQQHLQLSHFPRYLSHLQIHT